MRASILAVGTLSLVGLGCAGLDSIVPPVGSDGVPVPVRDDDPTPDPEPDPQPDPQPRRAAPADSPYPEMVGWVGHGVDADAEDFWVPTSGGQVVSWDGAVWSDVAVGGTFAGVTRKGTVDLTFTGLSDVPWCGSTRSAATFSAPEAVAGPVWIATAAPEARPSAPREIREATATRRLFKVAAGAEVDIQRTGGSGRTVVEWGGGRPWFAPFEAAGADLRTGTSPGASWPTLVLHRDNQLSILFRIHGDQTLAFEWVRIIGRKGESLGRTELAAAGCG